ncbi:MAG: hypothetical protein B1H09_01095 [Gemmatimonadaceae bacterium 4484_173]|nr:MAG: hypothetical protein B1H09_01095 [Gemmatimonadaceae bacterium 4484_173]RKZ02456.1 MAG: hypothetical protein DRQ21_08635 [Candidatus Fermentibacteria bacterium]
MKSFIPVGLVLLLAAVLYIPTLHTGFLTDDFLDCNHTLSEVPAAFSSQYGGGYRPLMILSWALDNKLWSVENQTGWHAVNLFLLLVSSLCVYFFLGRFLKRKSGVIAGTALFAFSFPMAVAVARVSWRTTVLALIPFLVSLILVSVWSSGSNKKWLAFAAAFFFLVSLLVKETAVSALPVIAVVAYCSAPADSRWKKTLKAVVIAMVPLLIYALLRYRAMGFGVNYSASTSFGLFMVKNLILQNAVVWAPWLSSISARVLFLLFPAAVYFVIPLWKYRILVFTMGVFMILPVSNLTLRPDLSVAALPGSALFLGFLAQRLQRKVFLYPLGTVFFAGVILFSRDEIKTLIAASDYVENTTQRLAEIAGELPGSGPLFVEGVNSSVGVYGTFWPGEYMVPMQMLGIDPGRFVTGTDRMWEGLITEGEGYLVFMDENGISYRWAPVSVDMYEGLPDTAIAISGPVVAGELIRYPSCTKQGEPDPLYLVSSTYPDSVVTVFPEISGGEAVYNLAAEPVWLASDGVVLLAKNSQELVFSSRNISLEQAVRNLEAKP